MRRFINFDLESRTHGLNVLSDVEVNLASQVFRPFCISYSGYRRSKKLSHSKYNARPSENYRLKFYFFLLNSFSEKYLGF
jgi:hypothetical protein